MQFSWASFSSLRSRSELTIECCAKENKSQWKVSSTKSLVALANLPIGFISPLHLANCCKQFEMSLSAFKSANLAATGVALSKKWRNFKRRICCCKQFVSKWNGIICSCFLIFLFAWNPVEEVKRKQKVLSESIGRVK